MAVPVDSWNLIVIRIATFLSSTALQGGAGCNALEVAVGIFSAGELIQYRANTISRCPDRSETFTVNKNIIEVQVKQATAFIHDTDALFFFYMKSPKVKIIRRVFYG